MNYKDNLKIYSFYRFIKIRNKISLKQDTETFIKSKKIRGTILLSEEGINGSLSGEKRELDQILTFIRKLLKIRKINLKINQVDFIPFNKMKVRLKKEIISLGSKNLINDKFIGDFVSPKEWDMIIKENETKVIDVRNLYEIKIGKFKGSLNPKTENFREFPNSIKKLKIKKDDKIAIYCTGGIRCEKASALLKKNGYKKVVQLEGGILNYLSYINDEQKNTRWTGECFVFDQRVSVKKNLLKGKYSQCYGCRSPITEKDKKSKKYKKGVYCPYCVDNRTANQIFSSQTRQSQIESMKKKKLLIREN